VVDTARPSPRGVEGGQRFLHLAAFWSLAVVQPIFSVLAENPEFFVAHAARPVDLIAFVLLMCTFGPVLGGLVVWCADRVRVGTITNWAIVSFLLALVALPIFNRSWTLELVTTLVIAAAVGAGLAAAYMWLRPLRLFATFLSPAIIVVPMVFLAATSIQGLVWSPQDDHVMPEVSLAHTPPIVMVVFDQLPLPSLLGRDGSIDGSLYPSFEALAQDAVWFSGATAVADLTEMALPAVVTGQRPVVGRLPTAAEHPGNLFTLLGSRYRVLAAEPITRLCPDIVCRRSQSSVFRWFGSVLSDVAVVYLHLVSPPELADRLPAITQNWKNFVANDNWRGRWARHRDGDRRVQVKEFLDAVEPPSEDRPSFYFLHVLLPHEPWVHLPSGQRYSVGGRMAGLNREGRWTEDESAVLRAYQRHLLQVRFADALLGDVVARLRDVGLYDDALVVVTSDHGASFQSDFLFRRPRPESFAEIASVPLFVKLPKQEAGRVVTANVETIDIAPVIAGVLGATLPWEIDGVDALAPDISYRAKKVLVFSDGQGEAVASSDIHADIDLTVMRKFARFETPNGFDQPRLGLHDELVGRSVDEFVIRGIGDIRVEVDLPDFFRDVDPAADFVLAHITGAVVDLAENAEMPALAVAVNGIVAAMTRPYAFRVAGRRHTWEVVVDPAHIVAGSNEISVFAVRVDETGGVALHTAYRSAGRDTRSAPNLILQPAGHLFGVTTTGFFDIEWSRQRPFRWTSDTAVVRMDRDTVGASVTELLVEVLMTGPMPKTLELGIDGCALFEGEIFGAWSQSFPLGGCQLDGDLEIEIRSTVSGPTPTDSRALGVAVSRLELH